MVRGDDISPRVYARGFFISQPQQYPALSCTAAKVLTAIDRDDAAIQHPRRSKFVIWSEELNANATVSNRTAQYPIRHKSVTSGNSWQL
jgi:hypothetical protein